MIRDWTHPSIKPGDVFITDNGRTLCGEHLGMEASATLRDISGQAIHRVTPGDVRSHGPIACETCGRCASSLHREA